MNKRIPILVIASALALSACGSSTPTVSMDYPTYSTVAELDRVADVVVLGQIGARTSTGRSGTRDSRWAYRWRSSTSLSKRSCRET